MEPVDVATLLVFAYALYLMFIGVFGLYFNGGPKPQNPSSRFLILIPAHNEEAVIDKLLTNLKQLDYPDELYDIVVLADNCTDKTVEIAKQGAAVLCRENGDKRGKGFAIQYAFEQLRLVKPCLARTTEYDAVVIFDADNLVQPNYLRVMNNHLLAGEKLVQCMLDSKNPTDTWVTGAYSILLWLNNRYALLSRYNLGLCAWFMGTGICIATDVLWETGWDTSTLTEDMEYSARALLAGYKISYAHETRIYDEKPLKFVPTLKQRLRWARGQFNVAFRYAPSLLYRGLIEADPAKFEGGIKLCQLFFVLLAPVIGIVQLVSGQDGSVVSEMTRQWPLIKYVLSSFPYVLMGALLFSDRHPFGVYKYMPFYLVFIFTWVLLLAVGLLTFRQGHWYPTSHNRSIGFGDLMTPKRDLAE